MARTTISLPSLQRTFSQLGENIRLARLRRKFSASLIAERAGMTRVTLRAIERGEPGVTLGAYANVLFCLGMHENLADIARIDPLGRKLQDAEVGIKKRSRQRVEQ